MMRKVVLIVAVGLALAGCQTTSNQSTDAFVKSTLEKNATAPAPAKPKAAQAEFPVAPADPINAGDA